MGMDDTEDAVNIEGVVEARKKVKDFLSKYKNSPEVEGTLVAELYQVSPGGEEMVTTCEYEQGEDLMRLVDEVIDAAVEDAEGVSVGGKVKYAVKVEGLRGRIVFGLKVNMPEGEDDIEDINDLPNKRGLITQQMRHNEKIMKVAMSAVKDFGSLMQKALQDKDHRISDLEKTHLEGIRLYADLAQAKHVQDMEVRKFEKEEKRNEQIVGTLVQGAPVLVNLLAQKMAPSSPQQAAPSAQAPVPQMQQQVTPLEGMLEGFLKSVTREQVDALMASGVLSPAQTITLIEMAKEVQRREEERAGAMQAAEEAAKAAAAQ